MPPSAHSARADLERLRGASGTAGDASPFRTAMRNIIAACRNSPLALASYCQQGVLPALAAALQQPQVMSSTQLGTCVLEVALCLTQQLMLDHGVELVLHLVVRAQPLLQGKG